MHAAQISDRHLPFLVGAIPGAGLGFINYIQNVVASPADQALFAFGGPFLFLACFIAASLTVLPGHALLKRHLRAKTPIAWIAALQLAYFSLASVFVFASIALATTAYRFGDHFQAAFASLYFEIIVTCLPVWALVYAGCLSVLVLLERWPLERHLSARAQHFSVSAGHHLHRIPFSDILYLQAKGNYVEIITGRSRIMARKTLGAVESGLPPQEFVRLHRSFIARVDAIRCLGRSDRGLPHAELSDGTVLPIGKTRLQPLREILHPRR